MNKHYGFANKNRSGKSTMNHFGGNSEIDASTRYKTL